MKKLSYLIIVLCFFYGHNLVADELDPTFLNVFNNVLVKCIGCHQGEKAPLGLDMSTPDLAYKNLVDINSREGQSFGGVKRITPLDADPKKSYIIAKLIADDQFRIGGRMPRGGPFLTDDEIQLVIDWINMGAEE